MSLRLLPHFHLASLLFDPQNIRTHFPDFAVIVLGNEIRGTDFSRQVICRDALSAIFTLKCTHNSIPVIIAGAGSALINEAQNSKIPFIAVDANDPLSRIASALRDIQCQQRPQPQPSPMSAVA